MIVYIIVLSKRNEKVTKIIIIIIIRVSAIQQDSGVRLPIHLAKDVLPRRLSQ